jgi:uncharacterized protein YgiM (DUF1202 family)
MAEEKNVNRDRKGHYTTQECEHDHKKDDTGPREPQRIVRPKERVNLRAEPSFRAAVVGAAEADTELTVLAEEADGWLKVDGGYTFGGNVR